MTAKPPLSLPVDHPEYERVRAKLAKADYEGAGRALRESERAGGEKAAKVESPLEKAFLELWREHGNGVEPRREYRFSETRRFRWDFCWPSHLVAVEIDGMRHHGNFTAWRKDAVKRNIGVLEGWRLLTYTAKDLKERPEEVVGEVLRLLEAVK